MTTDMAVSIIEAQETLLASPKECLHEYQSVYYGSEWVVECKKCGKSVSDIYAMPDREAVITKYIAGLKSKQ